MQTAGVEAKDIAVEDVLVPMRDGVRLHTRIYRPQPQTERLSVLVARSPYSWDLGGGEAYFDAGNSALAREGFVVVAQQVRGRYRSEGRFYPQVVEFDDGYDAVEWAAAQPWSNGRVGMVGSSYGGMVQWAAAAAKPPHLVAIAPIETAWRFYNVCYHSKGILNFDIRMAWTALMAEHEAERRGINHPVLDAAVTMQEIGAAALAGQGSPAVLAASTKMRAALWPLFEVRPARELEVFKDVAPWWSDWLSHIDPDDEFWAGLSGPARVADIQVPAIHHTGWYDFFLPPTLEAFRALREHGANERVRTGQKLVIGPYAHGLAGQPWEGHLAGMGIPDPARQSAAMRYLDRWLNHDGEGAGEPPIRLFVMGPNVWRDEHEWPLARTRWTDFYLRAEATLSQARPGDELPDTFVYDPENPVPQHGGPLVQMMSLPGPGPFDQREIEARDDVLVYTSAPLESDVEVTGPVHLELWASSSAVDTDFVAKLVEVFPDGRAINICQGIVRSRYAPEVDGLLEPGRPYRFEVDLSATSNVFFAGHRIRLEVTSSCFPTYDLNPNTGAHYFDEATFATRTARQRVFHDPSRPSRLILPVV